MPILPTILTLPPRLRLYCRCDFNVPQDANGAITNPARIVGALPSIEHALKNGAK